MLRFGKVTPEELEALAEAKVASAVTYDAVGATMSGELPRGFRHHRHEISLGPRDDAFEVARRGLRDWRARVAAGLLVEPRRPPARGATVAIAAPVGPVTALAVCRIVGVVDEENRYGFAYGMLPGHPERGEEAFMVERSTTGTTFRLVAFSRPGETIARVAGPYNRIVQRRITRGYLTGLASWVASAPAA